MYTRVRRFLTCPVNNKIGANDMRVIRMELKMAFPTNLEDLSMRCILSSLDNISGFCFTGN